MAKAPTEQQSKLVKVILPQKEEGYYSFTEYEIQEADLKKYGKLVHKSEYDILAIVTDQIKHKVMDIFGL